MRPLGPKPSILPTVLHPDFQLLPSVFFKSTAKVRLFLERAKHLKLFFTSPCKNTPLYENSVIKRENFHKNTSPKSKRFNKTRVRMKETHLWLPMRVLPNASSMNLEKETSISMFGTSFQPDPSLSFFRQNHGRFKEYLPTMQEEPNNSGTFHRQTTP